MKKEVIQPKGITRNTDSGVSGDGECMELVNLRPINGSLRPISKPILKDTLMDSYDKVAIHYGHGYRNYIGVKGGRVDAYIDGVKTVLMEGESVRSIQFIGNTLSVLAENQTNYFLFKKDHYQVLGSKPQFPIIQFTLAKQAALTENNLCNIPDPIKIAANSTYTLNSSNSTQVSNAVLGIINKQISEASSEGYIVYPIQIRYALRLFDGSYIMHSPPILLLTEARETNLVKVTSARLNSGGSLTDFNFDAIVYRSILNYIFTHDLEGWEDVVSSVDLFVSRQIKTIDLTEIESFTTGATPTNITLNIKRPGDDKIKEDILGASHFYKIHSFSLSAPASGSIQKSGMLDNLEQKEYLTDDEFTHNSITGVGYVYNSRLHVGSVQTKLSPLYDIEVFLNKSQTLFDIKGSYFASAQGRTEVHIETESGRKVVTKEFYFEDAYGFTPMISYPDIRAKKIIIDFFSQSSYYHKVFELAPHPYLNLAYYLDKLAPIQKSNFADGSIRPEPVDDIEYSNKIKVSEVSNPFFFPAKNTYTPSGAEVIAMCSNTAPVSQGQFGQYPLYIFAKDGVYSLSPGSDGVLYAVSAPVTRNVCNNPNVLPIDEAVVFATAQGLMLIYGGTVQNLSTALDGQPSIAGTYTDKILQIAGLSVKSGEEFRVYLEGSTFGFNYVRREIIVSNPTKDYSYVYNLTSGTWSKLSGNIDGYVSNAYPECLYFADDKIFNIENPDITTVDIALITRPIKYGTASHKKILQSALRGLFNTTKVGFYVLGSNDTQNYDLLSGKESSANIRDLIIQMNKSKAYKYYVVCVTGNLRSDSYINLFESVADESFDNRLR